MYNLHNIIYNTYNCSFRQKIFFEIKINKNLFKINNVTREIEWISYINIYRRIWAELLLGTKKYTSSVQLCQVNVYIIDVIAPNKRTDT